MTTIGEYTGLVKEKKKETCAAVIKFGDDYGEHVTTFHCQLPPGHKGKHKEQAKQGDGIDYLLEWDGFMDEDDYEYEDYTGDE